MLAHAQESPSTGFLEAQHRVGDTPFRAVCHAPLGRNLRIDDLKSPDPETRDAVRAELRNRIAELGPRVAFAPRAGSFTARIASPGIFSEFEPKIPGVTLLTNPSYPADGLPLDPGQSFALSTGGCGLFVMSGEGHLIAAHAGLWSLVDQHLIDKGAAGREHPSVVHAAVAHFKGLGIRPGQLRAWMLFYVDPDEYHYKPDDLLYGKRNKRLCAHLSSLEFGPEIMDPISGSIDLGRLAVSHAHSLGIPHAKAEFPISRENGFASTGDTDRNLVIIARH